MDYKLLNSAKLVLSLGIIYMIFHITGVGCPIRYMTGISCAGCGMTRAWFSVLRMDVSGAFIYHPLFWTIPLAIPALLFRERIPRKFYQMGTILLVLCFVLVYLVRLVNPSDMVVQINVKQGFIFKVISRFFQLFCDS